jgi:hypothetical protein
MPVGRGSFPPAIFTREAPQAGAWEPGKRLAPFVMLGAAGESPRII